LKLLVNGIELIAVFVCVLQPVPLNDRCFQQSRRSVGIELERFDRPPGGRKPGRIGREEREVPDSSSR
jgi:hypothetical protein